MRGYQYHPPFIGEETGAQKDQVTCQRIHKLGSGRAEIQIHILAVACALLQPVLLSITGTRNRKQTKVVLFWWQQGQRGTIPPPSSTLKGSRKHTGKPVIRHYLLILGTNQKSDMTYLCRAGIKILVSEVFCGCYCHFTPKGYKENCGSRDH